MRRAAWLLVGIVVVWALLVAVGCKRDKAEAPTGLSASAAAGAGARGMPPAPAPGATEQPGTAEGGGAGSGAPPGGGPPGMPELPKELVSSSGEKITVFGPVGPQMLNALMMMVGAGGQPTIDGDNKGGTVKVASMGGTEVTADYKATDAGASSLGIELPKSAERKSGFQVSGKLPEEQAKTAKVMLAQMQGQSESQVPPVTDADLKFVVSCGVYVMQSAVPEAAAAVKAAGGSRLGEPFGFGDDNRIFQFASDPTKLVWVQAVPDSDQVQVSVVSLSTCPEYMKSALQMMPAMAAQMQQAREDGGPGGPGGPGSGTGGAPGMGKGPGMGGMRGGGGMGKGPGMMKVPGGAGKGPG